MSAAESPLENEHDSGALTSGVGADKRVVAETTYGPDPATLQLGILAATFEDIQRTRKSAHLRAVAHAKDLNLDSSDFQDSLAENLKKIEGQASRQLKAALKRHPLWPWLEPLKGVSGPITARLVAVIADPHKFPGQKCSEGHYFRPLYEVGAPCPVVDLAIESDGDSGCPGTMLPPRPGTGTRSLWHYLGLHAVDGRSPRRVKGERCDWNPKGRTLVLGPDGIADQIVKWRPPAYGHRYENEYVRLAIDRGTAEAKERAREKDFFGAAFKRVGREGADFSFDFDDGTGSLRPFQVHAIAKKVAAKAFVGDLLIEWKRVS